MNKPVGTVGMKFDWSLSVFGGILWFFYGIITSIIYTEYIKEFKSNDPTHGGIMYWA